MAEIVAKNVRLYIGGRHFSTEMQQCTLTVSNELLDNTKMGSSGRTRIAGLHDMEIAGTFFFESGTSEGPDTFNDPHLHELVGSSSQIYTVLPAGTSNGNVAYMGQAMTGELSKGGSVGELMMANFTAQGDREKTIRGNILEIGSLSTGVTASPFNIGAVTSSETFFMVAHPLSFTSSNSSITIELVSADTSGMGTPSTFMSVTLQSSADSSAGSWNTTSVFTTSSDSWIQANLTVGSSGDSMTGIISVGRF